MKKFENLKKLIQQSEITSFDLFDTLLVRPYWKPTDLFLHLEYLYNAKDFCKERIKAEKLSRKNLGFGVDTNFDRIYQFIPEKYRNLKEKELELECDILQANSEILDIFNYAKSLNKEIIISSDMYLPEIFIKKVLAKLNITGYSKIYLSCEYRKTKISGKLYKQIINDFNVSADKILHIGDNKISDVTVPKILGIKAFHYEKINEQFINGNKTFRKLVKNNNLTLGLSTSLAICAINWNKQKYKNNQKNYFYNLGFNIGGMSAYSFCRFAAEYVKQKNIEKVFFVARGGYTLKKIFNLLYPEIKTSYVILSRIQNSINKLLENETDSYSHERYFLYKILVRVKNVIGGKFVDKLINKFYPMDFVFYHKVLNFISRICKNADIFKGQNFTVENSKKFYFDNKDRIDILLTEQKENFSKYLNEESRGVKNISILDDCAINFSAQKICEDLLINKKIYGAYFQVFNKNIPNKTNIDVFDEKITGLFDWEFMEFLFTAPTPPILGIDKDFNIIYEQANDYEQKRIEFYKDVSEGIIDFTKETKYYFKDRNIFITNKDVSLWINNFFKNYTKDDYKNMLGIYTTPDQERYFPLFSYNPVIKEIFYNPVKYLYNCSHVICPTFLQKIAGFPIRLLRHIVNWY